MEAFNASEFMARETVPNQWPCDLTDIHPIFRPANFRARVVRHLLQVPLALATQLLLAPQVQTFWHTIVNTDPTYTPATRISQGCFTYSDAQNNPDRILTAAQRERIINALDNLRTRVTFTLRSDVNEVQTVPAPDRNPAIARRPEYFADGVASEVQVGRNMFNQLRDATNSVTSRSTAGDIAILRIRQFEMVVMVAHEVSHSMQYARSGRPAAESHYGRKSAMAETGFEMEERLFGGHPILLYDGPGTTTRSYQYRDQDRNRQSRQDRDGAPRSLRAQRALTVNLPGVLVMFEWPDRNIHNFYASEAGMVHHAHRHLLPEIDMAWRLPLHWLAPIYTKESWKQIRNSTKRRELAPEKELRYYFKSDRRGTVRTPKKVDPDHKVRNGCVRVEKPRGACVIAKRRRRWRLETRD